MKQYIGVVSNVEIFGTPHALRSGKVVTHCSGTVLARQRGAVSALS